MLLFYKLNMKWVDCEERKRFRSFFPELGYNCDCGSIKSGDSASKGDTFYSFFKERLEIMDGLYYYKFVAL